MELSLRVVGGRNDGVVIEVSGPKFLIGRADECNIRPKSSHVSRRHAEIVIESEKATISDLGSRTGTIVNGKQTTANQPVEIKNGDTVRIGPVEFAVQVKFTLARQKLKKVETVGEAAALQGRATNEADIDISQWLQTADEDIALGETVTDVPARPILSAADLLGVKPEEDGDAKKPDKKAEKPASAEIAPDQVASDMLKSYLRRR